jgi:hypothetical protein
VHNRLFQASRRTDYNRFLLPGLDANAEFYLLFRRPLTAAKFCHKLGLWGEVEKLANSRKPQWKSAQNTCEGRLGAFRSTIFRSWNLLAVFFSKRRKSLVLILDYLGLFSPSVSTVRELFYPFCSTVEE